MAKEEKKNEDVVVETDEKVSLDFDSEKIKTTESKILDSQSESGEVLDKVEEVKEEKTEEESKKDNDNIDEEEVEIDESKLNDTEKYYESVGRRKKSVARVRLYTRKSTDSVPEDSAYIVINDKPHFEYLNDEELKNTVESPLRRLKSVNRFKATVLVKGGGISGQAGAIRHGLTRALILFDNNFSKKMRKAGFLTRDSRVKERKKYGLKKARKAPQWAKR